MKYNTTNIFKASTLVAMIIASYFVVTVADIASAAGAIEIKKAWLRATPPSAMAGGGYLIITNSGQNDDTLIGVNFSGAKKSEIHEMKMSDGVMKMRPLEHGINIPAGKTVTLKPGGFHLMFMGLKDQLKDGQSFQIMLEFANSGKMEVKFPVLTREKGKKFMMQDE